jgi:hypothetical protein
MKTIFNLAVLLCGLVARPLEAQLAVPPPMPAYPLLAAQQLDQLLAPIALYPDPLLAQILPAATLPAQIVLADRYVTSGGDPNQFDQQPWDASVQGLAHYPGVLKWMDDNLSWTTEVGQAFLYQQQDVMDSIQRLRRSAYNLGNLQSTPQLQVVDDGGDIEILPADPGVIYVPVYQPDQTCYQSGYGLSFGIGFAIGGWLNCDFDWHNHHLVFWGRDHPRPAGWWHERPDQRVIVIRRQTTVWSPEGHRATGMVSRGDRGWDNHQPARPAGPEMGRPEQRPVAPQQRTVTIIGQSANRPEPVSRPASNPALIGVQSSQQTRTYSNRGQQSMQTVPHSAPVSRPAAPVSHPAPSSGGGGGHGSGSQPRH